MSRGRILSIQQGNYLGSIPPYGYEKTIVTENGKKCPTLKIKEDEANIVRMIFEWYVTENIGRNTIATRLDNMGIKPPKGEYWSAAYLKDMLDNAHYIGKVKWNFRKTVMKVEDGEVIKTRPKANVEEYLRYDGKHEAIISEELFYKAVEKRGRNAKVPKSREIKNPFAGLLFCKCGRAMSLRTYKHPDGTERSPSRMLCDQHTKCNSGSCQYDEFTELVKGILEQCIEDFEVRVNSDNKDALRFQTNLIKDLEKKLEALEEKEIGLWDKFSENGMPEKIFNKLNEKVLKEKDEVSTALCNAKESMPDPVCYEEKLTRFRNALDALCDDETPARIKNKLLKDCIERIEYSRAKPERLKSNAKRVTVNGRRIRPDGLPTGGNWTKPPIDLDVKLRV
jgi:hypothetical protein